MKTSIEIEFKTIVSKDEYEKLIDLLELRDNIFHQENYYFDTEDFALRKNNMALRIRHRKNVYKITLKRPNNNCLYEDSIIINEETAKAHIKNGFNLQMFGMDMNVELKAVNETERAVTPYKEGNLFLDQSTYAGITDYEIEYEADEYNNGIKIFHEFLEENNLTYEKIEHKIDRVYRALGL